MSDTCTAGWCRVHGATTIDNHGLCLARGCRAWAFGPGADEALRLKARVDELTTRNTRLRAELEEPDSPDGREYQSEVCRLEARVEELEQEREEPALSVIGVLRLERDGLASRVAELEAEVARAVEVGSHNARQNEESLKLLFDAQHNARVLAGYISGLGATAFTLSERDAYRTALTYPKREGS